MLGLMVALLRDSRIKTYLAPDGRTSAIEVDLGRLREPDLVIEVMREALAELDAREEVRRDAQPAERA